MWLWEWIDRHEQRGGSEPQGERCLYAGTQRIHLEELLHGSMLGAALEALRGRNVLLATLDQLSAALALLELDGLARRVVLCPPDLNPAHLASVAGAAQLDAAVGAFSRSELEPLGIRLAVPLQAALQPLGAARRPGHETEWVLLTSGTSGPPKLVQHTIASLTSAFGEAPAAPAVARSAGASDTANSARWTTFYDIRRYGGLQILLRALGGGSILLSSASQPVAAFLARAGALGITHISGTASHWRAVLMSGAASRIRPRYVRLSGEIADQGILDALRSAYPEALIAHAFASTEAGVAFEVEDGRAGFPAARVDTPGRVALRVVDGSLRVRSEGAGARYLGAGAAALRDPEGYVDTGDRVELRDGRYYFMGRSGGIINVGGLKVHPEEVEAVINTQPWVRMSLVQARRSPITGAVVTAEVVLMDAAAGATRPAEAEITAQIAAACRRALPAHKVPAMIKVVPSLAVSAAGKLVRPGA